MFKGFFAAALGAAMLLTGTLSTEAMAAKFVTIGTGGITGVYYPTVDAAIKAAKEGDTIYLSGEIELANQLSIDKSVTIDGNGTAVISGGSFTFKGKSTTIKNAAFSAPDNGCLAGSDLF